MRAYERLLNYVKIDTTSDPQSSTIPSAAKEFDLSRCLEQEMKAMGLSDVHMEDNAYVYGKLPASEGYESLPVIGLIAHMDTAPDFNGTGVNPQIHPEYDGEAVVLGTSGRVLSPETFPHLKSLKGRTLITTDGTTLLGADDKAGIAEILTALERLMESGSAHRGVSVCFTPDEEIGSGASELDLERFGAAYAYTLDGGAENEIVYETFNACAAEVTVNGFNIHPGEAKDKMINASLVAMEFNSMLPSGEVPSKTEMYEGFFHLCDMTGDVEKASLNYIVRDHSAEHFRVRKEMLRHIEKTLNARYGEGTVTVVIRDQYRNMAEKIEPCMEIVDKVKAILADFSLIPDVSPVRGGTDGACLSFRGLPCPNLGTGGYAFHGPYEHITAEGMDTAVEILIRILTDKNA